MDHPAQDEQGRPEPPMAGDEVATTLGFLEFFRATVGWKCAGVDAAGLRVTIGQSAMSLGGLLKHLAFVEDYWFSVRLHGNDPAEPWASAPWGQDPDWEWHSAGDKSPADLLALWTDTVERSRQLVGPLADGDLDRLAVGYPADAEGVPSLRWILQHMNEEYARRCGHADLLREAVDGMAGE